MALPTMYVSRRVRIPSHATTIVFDGLLGADGTEGHRSVVAPPAVLVLCGAPPVAPGGPLVPLRARTGRLRSAPGWRWFPVELELVAWSGRVAELGVRPRGRTARLADGRRQRRYLDLAVAVADHLAAELEAAFAAWERDVVAEAAALVRPAVGT